jgi:hypothetical protein
MHRLLLLAILGCGETKNAAENTGIVFDEVNEDCDPTAPTMCGLPFPSTYYMAEDSTSPTGWRVALGPTTLPVDWQDNQPTPDLINEKDGWSPLTPLLAHFPGVSLDGVIGHDNLGAYTDADARTVIVDVATGERVPHFVELDVTSSDPERTVLLLHPVTPMAHGHRYAVGIRGLVDEQGQPIEASDGFAALRDGVETTDPRVERRRSVYEDIVFPALTAAGIQQAELQLAWDFVIASREGLTEKARWMRDDALERIGPNGPAYTVDLIDEQPSDQVAMRIHGHFFVPMYMEQDRPGVLLTRDADGMPYANGETMVRYTIIVPQTAIDDPRPLPLIQYGHGLLGSQDEVHGSYLGEFANQYGYILFAVDWTGMKDEDVADITLMLITEVERFSILPERSHQGFVEFAAAMRLMSGRMVDEPLLQGVDSAGNNTSFIDPDRRYYYGNSQGAILGGAYIGLAQDFDRAVLGVGGMPYHLLLNRSADFDPFFLLFKQAYPDPGHVQLLLALIQTIWDSGEASGYAQVVTDDPLADTPAKDVLLQVAIGDAQVTTLGAHVMARAYGARLIEDPVRPVWGLETVASGHEGSALVEFDYGLHEPFENTPPDAETDPHEYPRRDLAGQEQIHTFFQTGIVEHFCEGPCGEPPR